MSLEHWTDYHAWRVSREAMKAAGMALDLASFSAMIKVVKLADGGFLVPREAIEDAALAMPSDRAHKFLSDVYDLSAGEAARLLTAIQSVRQ